MLAMFRSLGKDTQWPACAVGVSMQMNYAGKCCFCRWYDCWTPKDAEIEFQIFLYKG